MPPNPPSEARRCTPRDTSGKRDLYFTPIFSPSMFEHGFTPLIIIKVVCFTEPPSKASLDKQIYVFKKNPSLLLRCSQLFMCYSHLKCEFGATKAIFNIPLPPKKISSNRSFPNLHELLFMLFLFLIN